MGDWLSANGDSIYGTTYGPVQGIASLRTTAKANSVFVHVFDWPAAPLEITGLNAKVIRAHVLSTGQTLTFRQDASNVQIDVAAQAPDPNVSTIVLSTL
jgi:alpha-L-fucosidase